MFATKMTTTNVSELEKRIGVTDTELATVLGCGLTTARRIALEADAVFRIGKRKFNNLPKVIKYVDSITEDFKMDKYIYDKNNGLWYELQGDYYIPCLTLPAEEKRPIGIWGQRHKRYLKEHKKAVYTTLLTSSKLNSYLADIDEQAEEMFSRLVKQLAFCNPSIFNILKPMCLEHFCYFI